MARLVCTVAFCLLISAVSAVAEIPQMPAEFTSLLEQEGLSNEGLSAMLEILHEGRTPQTASIPDDIDGFTGQAMMPMMPVAPAAANDEHKGTLDDFTSVGQDEGIRHGFRFPGGFGREIMSGLSVVPPARDAVATANLPSNFVGNAVNDGTGSCCCTENGTCSCWASDATGCDSACGGCNSAGGSVDNFFKLMKPYLLKLRQDGSYDNADPPRPPHKEIREDEGDEGESFFDNLFKQKVGPVPVVAVVGGIGALAVVGAALVLVRRCGHRGNNHHDHAMAGKGGQQGVDPTGAALTYNNRKGKGPPVSFRGGGYITTFIPEESVVAPSAPAGTPIVRIGHKNALAYV